MTTVTLIRGPLEDKVFEEESEVRAIHRAGALAELHGCEAIRTIQRDWIVNAGDYYRHKR